MRATEVTLRVEVGPVHEPTCTATLTVTDNTPPTITTCARDQSAFANGVCQAPVPDFTSGVVATDCNGSTPQIGRAARTERVQGRVAADGVTVRDRDGAGT